MDIENKSRAYSTSTTLSIVMKHCRQAKTAGVVLNPQSFILDCVSCHYRGRQLGWFWRLSHCGSKSNTPHTIVTN